jgi:Cathepsin C exclusion domain
MRAPIILLVIMCTGVYADLPVHCLKHQVVGRWKLYIGAP